MIWLQRLEMVVASTKTQFWIRILATGPGIVQAFYYYQAVPFRSWKPSVKHWRIGLTGKSGCFILSFKVNVLHSRNLESRWQI